jgi:hypothetical protein
MQKIHETLAGTDPSIENDSNSKVIVAAVLKSNEITATSQRIEQLLQRT